MHILTALLLPINNVFILYGKVYVKQKNKFYILPNYAHIFSFPYYPEENIISISMCVCCLEVLVTFSLVKCCQQKLR